MKKVRMMLCLVLVLALSFAGCSGLNLGSLEDTKWIEESAAKISDEITSGQFVIDGVIYQFPMPLTDWLNNGWEVSNSYDNVAEFRLSPYYTSTDFELFNEDDAYVRVTVFNNSDKEAPIEDCIVESLYMSTTEVDVVFPQGMTKRNKPAEILAAYGEPDVEEGETDFMEATYYFTDGELGQCYVELNAYDNNYTINPFTSIRFGIIEPEDYWGTMVNQKGVEGAAEFYFDAAMKTSFHGDFEDYVTYNMDTLKGAQELYDSEVEYFAHCLIYYTDITEEYATEEIMNRVRQVAKAALSKTKWEVKSVDVNAFKEGTMTLVLYPTNFFEVIDEDLMAASVAYNTKYADVDYENMTYEEYDALEVEYTEMMVGVLEQNVGKAGTLDAVEKTYKVDLEETVLSDAAWEEVDAVIMDLMAEE